MTNTWLVLLGAFVCATACDKKASQGGEDKSAAEQPAPARDKPAGPSLPALHSPGGVTFAVGKGEAWWFSVSFACYKAAIGLSPGSDVGAAFAQFPRLVPALQAGGLDLDSDVASLGGFDCGGELCAYAAVDLGDPAKLSEMVEVFAGEPAAVTQVAPHHFSFPVEGASPPRTLHVFGYAIDWSEAGTASDDPWAKAATDASHLILFYGVSEGGAVIDPAAHVAGAAEAKKRVGELEDMIEGQGGRCVAGELGERDFLDGFELDRARFVLAAPRGEGDALTRLMGSDRSLELRAHLTLSPKPTEAQAEAWVSQGRSWFTATIGEVRPALVAQSGEAANIIIDIMQLLIERGFSHQLDDNVLELSWQTRRVPASDLVSFESRLQQVLGQ